MKILAFECSTGPTSVVLWEDGAVRAQEEDLRQHYQASRLIPMIEAVLASAGTHYMELDAIATSTGPGSFTGIRIGIASARAIALAAGKTVYGVSSLQTMAQGAAQHNPEALPIRVMMQAGKGEYFTQLFSPLRIAQNEPSLIKRGDALPLLQNENTLLACNILEELAPLPQAIKHCAAIAFPHARDVAALAATDKPTAPLRPLYIRAPDAKLPASASHV